MQRGAAAVKLAAGWTGAAESGGAGGLWLSTNWCALLRVVALPAPAAAAVGAPAAICPGCAPASAPPHPARTCSSWRTARSSAQSRGLGWPAAVPSGPLQRPCGRCTAPG
jgi:hypothetical protein